MLVLLLQLADSHHGLLLLLHALLCELVHQRLLLVLRLLGWLDRGGYLRWRGCLLLLLLCASSTPTSTVAINCVEVVLLVLLLELLLLLLLLRLALSSSLLHVKVMLVLCRGCRRSRL